MLLPVKLIQRYDQENTLSEKSVKDKLKEIQAGKAMALDDKAQFERRRKMIASVSVESYEDAFERYIGDNDLLPINYLELGLLRSRAVGRIAYNDVERSNAPVVATGFLISSNLLLTNHHVLSDPQKFANPIVEFDYEYDIYGKEKPRITFELDPVKFFFSDQQLDIAIIGVKEKDVTGKFDLRERGYLILNETRGKIGVGDFASIIQHPEGKPKMVGLRENKILDISAVDHIVYSTDTTVGSSGGPVMNDQWQVIALHSAGVPKKEENGNYLDKDNNIIAPIDNRIDSQRVQWISNRGTKVSAIVNLLKTNPATNSNVYILDILTPSYTDDKSLAVLSHPKIATPTAVEVMPANGKAPKPVPQSINININLGDGYSGVTVKRPEPSSSLTALVDGFEKKYEDELDFSDCHGFDEYFLTDHTPLPKLSPQLKNKVAHYTDNPHRYVLKCHHFSSVQHAIRRQPIFAAINIQGLRRYEELSGRNDKWYRDNRIDYDVQLNDAFYKHSGFDKGHLCRREAAEWGSSMAFAELAANLTCSYANACPQVPTLNRARFGYHGIWGRLEIEILEKGIMAEDENQRKIVVFNGPVFKDDDPVFKGVQIPLHFWKVVVWRNPEGELKTTAFLLHQDRLVGDIEFELAYDEVFVTSQCSISYLEELTDLSFTKIREWDTYVPNNGNEHERFLKAPDIEKLVAKSSGTKKKRT